MSGFKEDTQKKRKKYKATIRLSAKQKMFMIWLKIQNTPFAAFAIWCMEKSEEFKTFEINFEKNKEWLEKELKKLR